MGNSREIDNIIKEINAKIASGMTKTAIAQGMGYKRGDGLYCFIRRKGYAWDQEKNMYVKEVSPEIKKAVEETPTGMASKVIALFKQGMGAKEIAKQLGFETCGYGKPYEVKELQVEHRDIEL